MLYVILLSVSGECGCVYNTQSFTNPLRSPLYYFPIFWCLPSEFIWGYLFWTCDIILNNNYFNLVLKPDYELKCFENWTAIHFIHISFILTVSFLQWFSVILLPLPYFIILFMLLLYKSVHWVFKLNRISFRRGGF